MRFPKRGGDRLIFREDFWTQAQVESRKGVIIGTPTISNNRLSGGQVSYSGPAKIIASAKDIALICRCRVETTGVNQALASVGDSLSVYFEVGITTDGRPYVMTANDSLVPLGNALSDGVHDIAFGYSNRSVFCVVDGLLWGGSVITLGSSFNSLTFGGSCLGTLPWSGDIRRSFVYAGNYDYKDVSSLSGKNIVWTPDQMIEGQTAIYWDNDAEGAFVLAAQPVVINGDFEAGAVGWTPYAATWTTVPRDGGLAAEITNLTIGYASFIRNDGVPNGCRSLRSVDARCGTASYFYVRDSFGGGDSYQSTTSTTWVTLIKEFETNGPRSDIMSYHATLTGRTVYADNFWIRNLSLNTTICKGNLGNLAQATNANKLWSSDPDAVTSLPLNGKRLVFGDGTADWDAGTLAAVAYAFHKAAGFTYLEMVRPNTGATGNDTLLDTCNASAANVGINVTYDATNQRLYVRVANGSGVFVVDGWAAMSKGLPHLVEATWTEADGLEIRIDDTPVVTQASVGAASAADATAVLQRGRRSGNADFYAGARGSGILMIGKASLSDRENWRSFNAAKYGIDTSPESTLAGISGAKLVWFASDHVLDAGVVSQINSLVGPDLIQITPARRPSVVENALNGRPALSFDGGDMLETVANVNLSGGTSATVVVVFKDTSAGASVVMEQGPSSVANPGLLASVNDGGATRTSFLVATGPGTYDAAYFLYDNSAYQNYEWEVDTTLGNPGEILARMTGASKAVTHVIATNVAGNLANNKIYIGARTGLVAPLTGTIVMAAIYSPKLSGTELTKMRAALTRYTGLLA